MPIKISGAGCCLVDQIYNGIDFDSSSTRKYLSQRANDGGLHPGRLVFSEQLEKFASSELSEIVQDIIGKGITPAFNVGGPSIVSLIHAAQLLSGIEAEINFFGIRGDDDAGEYLELKLKQTPVFLENLSTINGSTPSTIVLSDPNFNNGL